jgi:hypothetical protein
MRKAGHGWCGRAMGNGYPADGADEVAPCWFKVYLHVEKRETIVLKEGRIEKDVNVKGK